MLCRYCQLRTVAIRRLSAVQQATTSTTLDSKPIELISSRLHAQLFPRTAIPVGVSNRELPLQLPPLVGADIGEHFQRISYDLFEPYRRLLNAALLVDSSAASMPRVWILRRGWTRYGDNGANESVHCPREDAMFFDVEVCMRDGQLPTMAVVRTNEAWYGVPI
jgi:DNA polymerase gamma 1